MVRVFCELVVSESVCMHKNKYADRQRLASVHMSLFVDVICACARACVRQFCSSGYKAPGLPTPAFINY